MIPFLCNTLLNFVIGLLLAKFLGPAEYGRFALTLAIAMAVQTLCFDWLRLAAIRFYSERTRTEEPHVRATLDAGFAVLAAILSGAAALVLLVGIDVRLSPGLAGLAVAASIANGLFDYQTALVRARFHDRAYGQLIIAKNVLSLVLTVGSAVVFGSATMAVAGVSLSMVGSVVLSRGVLADREARTRLASGRLARTVLGYALPVVVANMLYQVIPLTDRAMAASQHGFAVSGQFSLAYDIGFRIASAIGSAMDVLLFQVAVRLDEHHGAERAKDAVARNMTIVLAVLAPACAGCWLVLPSFEHLVVPQEFQGPFGHYFTLLIPGLFCYACIHWVVNPVFQIGRRTAPLIAAALLACAANGLLLLVLPASTDASGYAVAQSVALAIGLACLVGFAQRLRPVWPRLRHLAAIALATGTMVAAVAPLRPMAPGVVALVVQTGAGVLLYGCLALALDIAGLRTAIRDRWGPAVPLGQDS